jgi:TRAP-type C4-dicarboxylate transport system substrate-binding protein
VTRDRAIRSLADLKGLRLRAPTELLRVLERIGADPVNMPMGEVYSAMSKGVIDGVVAPPDTFAALHFAEIARHYTSLAVPRGAYPARAMNFAKWNSLTEAQKAVLEQGVGIWETAIAEENRAAGERGMAEARRRGIQFATVSAAEQEKYDRLYLDDARRNAQALERFGIDGLETFRLARNSVPVRDQIRCEVPA